jgi:hypothetical protein
MEGLLDWSLVCFTLLGLGFGLGGGENVTCTDAGSSLYEFSVPALDGDTRISLSDHRGKVLLLVNVASF